MPARIAVLPAPVRGTCPCSRQHAINTRRFVPGIEPFIAEEIRISACKNAAWPIETHRQRGCRPARRYLANSRLEETSCN